MSSLSELIQKRLEEIASQSKSLEKAVRTSPEGKLRISSSRNKARFYQVKENENSQGRYLRRSEKKLAEKLAQKDYDKEVLKLLRMEEKALSKAAGYYENAVKRISAMGQKEKKAASAEFFSGPEELVWANTLEARRSLIKPAILDAETFAQDWMSGQYKKSDYPIDEGFRTRSGILVRSKTELIIADMLDIRGIPFYYERPLHLKGWGDVYPDFTVLNKRTRRTYYWEHMGMMDDDDYRDKALEKIIHYILSGHALGIDLILTHETLSRPIKTQVLERTIEIYLE